MLREIAQLGEKIQPMMPVVFTSTLGIGSGGQDSSSWHHLGEQVYSVSQTPQVWIDHVASERDGALWYTWRDPANPVGRCGWCPSAGLVDNDLDGKPAWREYTKLSGGTP